MLKVSAIPKQPINDTWIDSTLFYKFGTIYRPFLIHVDINICRAMHGDDLNIFEQMFIAHWKKYLSNVSICPIETIFEWQSSKTYSIFFDNYTRMPDGDYKLNNRVHLSNNQTIVMVEIKVTTKSKRGDLKMSMLEMG